MELIGFRMIKALKEYKFKKILYATINKDKDGLIRVIIRLVTGMFKTV